MTVVMSHLPCDSGQQSSVAGLYLFQESLLKKTDPLRRSLFQQPRVDKLASIRAINDCYNC